MNAPLLNVATEWQRLKQELIAQFGGGDDDALCDTLEGISDLPQMIERVMESIDDDLAFAAALKIQIEQRTERMERYQDRAESKRMLVEGALMRADLKRLELPACTLTIGKRPRTLFVSDESAIPAEFFRPQPPKLATSDLKRALEDGVDVPGAGLTNGGVGLNVRRK